VEPVIGSDGMSQLTQINYPCFLISTITYVLILLQELRNLQLSRRWAWNYLLIIVFFTVAWEVIAGKRGTFFSI